LEIIEPDGLDRPATYSQVIIAMGGRLVFVADQMFDDPDGALVHAGDLAGHARFGRPQTGPCRRLARWPSSEPRTPPSSSGMDDW
jgi:hypothetical protein